VSFDRRNTNGQQLFGRRLLHAVVCLLIPVLCVALASCVSTGPVVGGYGSGGAGGGGTPVSGGGGSGAGPALTASPSSLSFGLHAVGATSPAQRVTVTNSGSSAISISSIVANNPSFSISGGSITSLAAGQSAQLDVTFSPTAPTAFSSSLTINSSASNSPTSITLSGTGVNVNGQLSLSASSFNFGQNVVAITSAPRLLSITNIGNGSATISSITVSHADFAFTGATTPFTLSPNQQVTLSLTYTPSATGSVSATLTINSTATGSPNTVQLSGSGVTLSGTLSLSSTTFNFGQNVVGVPSMPRTLVVTNSGTVSVNITSIVSSNPEFTFTGATPPLTLAPTQSVTLSLTYTAAAVASSTGTLTITSTATNSPNVVQLSGSGASPAGTFTVSPSTLDFGQQAVGSSTAPMSVTVNNTGAGAAQINSVVISNAAYTLTGMTFPLSLSPGASVQLNFVFTPSLATTFNATATINSSASNSPHTVNLTGTGVTPAGVLSVSPTNLAFGQVVVGVQSPAQFVTISNTGAGPASISSITFDNAAFSFGGLALPASVGLGQSVQVSIFFTPAATGAANATMTITSTASNSPHTVTMDGTGIVLTGTYSLSATSLNFGQQAVGASSSPQTITVTNSGAGATQITSVAISNPAFTLSGVTLPVSLSPGASINLNFVFTPTSATTFNATATISGSASNSPQVINLTGDGVLPAGTFAVSPASISFGQQDVGVQSAVQTVTITNTGAGPASISAFAVNNPAFSVTGPALPASVGAGQSVQLGVSFTPTAVGPFNGTLTITSTASNSPNTVALDGSGAVMAGQLALNPTALNFGQVGVGTTSSSQSVTITNTGNAPVTINSISSNLAEFSVGALPLPISLSPLQNVQVSVAFTPSTATSFSATLTIISTASNSPTTLSMTGQGVGPQFTLSASSLNFGSQTVNTTSAPLSVTVTNVGVVDLSISAVSVTPSPGAFTLASGPTIPATVTPGNSVTFSVTFRPDAVQTFNGFLNITTNASATATAISLSGDGIAGTPSTVILGLSPILIDFGQQLVNQTSSARTVTITSNGTSALTVTDIQTSAPYSVGSFSTPLPATLNPGQSMTFSVAFRPTSIATFDAQVLIASNAPTTPDTVNLTGEGVSGFGGCSGTLTLSATQLDFGVIGVGTTSPAQTLTLSNTGSGTMTINTISVDESAYALSGVTTPLNLGAGASAQLSVTFSPTAPQDFPGIISFSGTECNPGQSVSLTGTGQFPIYTLTPSTLSFGNQTVGTSSATQTVTLTNTSLVDLIINSASISPTVFTFQGPTLPTTLQPSGTADFLIQFSPNAAQSFTGTFSVSTTGSPASSQVALSGTGTSVVAVIDVSPTAIDFLNQPVNTTSAPRSVLITNTGSAVVTISSVTTAAPFAVTGFGGSTTLNPGQSLTLSVTFSPTTTTTSVGTLTITSNSTTSPDVVALQGTGIVISGAAPYTAIDDRVLRVPPPTPALGTAGFRFTDPTFGSRMLRVTDANVRPDKPGFSYGTSPGAETNIFNTDSTKFYVVDQGGNVIPFNFDPVNMTTSRMGNTGNASGGLILPLRASPEFSRTDPDLIYGFKPGTNTFTEYRFSTGLSTTLHDPHTCLPSLNNHTRDITISFDAQRMVSYFGGTSLNDGFIIYIFDRSLGCRYLDISTGVVGGQWGPTGSINISERFTLHNVRISRDGQFLRLVRNTCTSGSCSAFDYFWDVNTLTVTPCTSNTHRCAGHKTMGFTSMINQSSVGDGYQWSTRPNSNITNRRELISPLASPTNFAVDSHPSWNNVRSGEGQPVCLANFYTTRPPNYIRAWDEEVICIRTDGVRSQVWRFAHHRSRGLNFNTFPRGNVSHDGRFYIFNSDWDGTVGTGRWDAFIVELK
jgi:hypothetical protein